MKQLILKNGKIEVVDVPAPAVSARVVLVQVDYSTISTGTEIAGVSSSGNALWRRAMKNPDEVKLAIKLASQQGIKRVYKNISNKINSGSTLGYSLAGKVIAVGEGIDDLCVGDMVACAGAQCAHHAEIVAIPRNLAVKVPNNLHPSEASTVALGAISLQGVRRLNTNIGETVVVLGLGLLGLISFQILKATGCRVIGLDINRDRLHLARKLGIDNVVHPEEENAVERVMLITEGYGADSVLVCASNSSDDILSLAFKMCRKKGKVTLIGDVGLNIKRKDIYQNEIDFQISTSYGPGRYDPTYEEQGNDYPYAYVRWTENRNMKEYLRLLSCSLVRLDGIITKTVPVEQAPKIYENLKNNNEHIAVLLKYSDPHKNKEIVRRIDNPKRNVIKTAARKKRVNIAVVGAGSFAKAMHLPNLERQKDIFEIRAIMSRSGHNAKAVSELFGAHYSTTDFSEIINDRNVDAVLIATRHNLHGSQVLKALKKNKHVFVEKPLSISVKDLNSIESLTKKADNNLILQTGFNRRYSPHIRVVKEMISGRTHPLIIKYTMNAGKLSRDSWVKGAEGGGRNLGEACHIYHLFTFLTGAAVSDIRVNSISSSTEAYSKSDNFTVTCEFSDGSMASLLYTAMGTTKFSKEKMEIFCEGKVILLDDYRSLEVFGMKHKGLKTKFSEKGQKEALLAFGSSVLSGEGTNMTIWEQIQATKIAFQVEKQLHDKNKNSIGI